MSQFWLAFQLRFFLGAPTHLLNRAQSIDAYRASRSGLSRIAQVHQQIGIRDSQPWMPISASNDLMPFQLIPTPMHSMMNADSLTTTFMPVFPISLLIRWA